MMYWEGLAFFTLLVLVIGYLATRGKFNVRRWVFIVVLFFLFIMVGVYGAQLASEKTVGSERPPERSWSEWNAEKELIEGVTLLGFGVTGLVLLVAFHTRKTLELGMGFGLSGCILTITGLIMMLEGRPASMKFMAAIIGVIIVSFLMYRYREQLIGE